MKQYTVIHEQGPDNWSAYAPDLPGCIATAKTREQLEQRIREATFALSYLRRARRKIMKAEAIGNGESATRRRRRTAKIGDRP